jgi:hypothetical protein
MNKFYCETCDINCSDKYKLEKHNKTDKHEKKLTVIKTPPVFPCICGCTYSTQSKLEQHISKQNKSNHREGIYGILNKNRKLVNQMI